MATVSFTVTIPDTAIPKIKAAFAPNATTNAQVLAAVQAWIAPVITTAIRDETLSRNLATRLTTAQAQVRADQAVVDSTAADETNQLGNVWP